MREVKSPLKSTVPTPAEARAILAQKHAEARAILAQKHAKAATAWEQGGKNALVAHVDSVLEREIRAGHSEFSIWIMDVQHALRATTDAEFDTHMLNEAVISAVKARGYYAGGKQWSHVQVNTQHAVRDGSDDCVLV